MNSFLERVQLATLDSVKNRKQILPQQKFNFSRDHNVDFLHSLTSGNGPIVIAEVKKQSPSLGALNLFIDPVSLVETYFNNGATAVSVVTEDKFFKGALSDLALVRKSNSSFPILQKDFIIDEYQIFEAKFLGADCILLIVALLGIEVTKRFQSIAENIGLAVLIEVHTERELHHALTIGCKIIGINNRDLNTLKISLDVSRKLIKDIPSEVFAISESGISSSQEMSELSNLGYQGFLIGSSLMQHSSPGEKLSELIKGVRS